MPPTVFAVKWDSTHDDRRCVVVTPWPPPHPPKPPPPKYRRRPPPATSPGDVVVDLALGHVLLELGQRGRRVRAVEPADGHDRIAAGQLVPRGVVRVHRRGHPGVAAGVGLQELGERGVGLARVEEPAGPRGAAAGRRSRVPPPKAGGPAACPVPPAGAGDAPPPRRGSPQPGKCRRRGTTAGAAAGESAAEWPRSHRRGSRRRRSPREAAAGTPGPPAGGRGDRRDRTRVRRGRGGDGGEQGRRQGGAEAERRHQGDRQLGDGRSSGSARMATTPRAPATPRTGAVRGTSPSVRPRSTNSTRRWRAKPAASPTRPAHAGAALPQPHGGDADQRAERRGQGHRVVGVDDALGQADDEPDARPASRPRAGARPAPGRCAGPASVSTSRTAAP